MASENGNNKLPKVKWPSSRKDEIKTMLEFFGPDTEVGRLTRGASKETRLHSLPEKLEAMGVAGKAAIMENEDVSVPLVSGLRGGTSPSRA